MEDSESCLVEEQRPMFKKMLENKIKKLEQELKDETEFYEENGLFHNRDTETIDKELLVARNVLKNLDNLPTCK